MFEMVRKWCIWKLKSNQCVVNDHYSEKKSKTYATFLISPRAMGLNLRSLGTKCGLVDGSGEGAPPTFETSAGTATGMLFVYVISKSLTVQM